jgi:hypothetical protein
LNSIEFVVLYLSAVMYIPRSTSRHNDATSNHSSETDLYKKKKEKYVFKSLISF